ncbi:gamma-butyrobetaine hydroxylase [Gloeophyllum trabeum ATCC 11539]|uniref:Gamma-butyrobetaine hydroxylase n=1 Tax=Gloeophyllum trabeum (strain ATCC 11539 / FP-39264 / Madison 617) TaxID=670483 RepID=S7Q7W1_GLOTA|nr:gamma-butyrobetaine hydroxylase [Gloeophyllum trabeum ATCC 11539]EPQ55528.1 gamma-butyrobetaine hydroxylase [Gloeophyllum trabeum ATCC 11539]
MIKRLRLPFSVSPRTAGRLHPHVFPPASRNHPFSNARGLSSQAVTIPALDNLTLPYVWLRDSCQCPSCIHPSTRQKLHRTSDLVAARPVPGGVAYHHDEGVLRVKWEGGHESAYERGWLERYADPGKLAAFHREVERVEWDAKRVSESSALFVPYEDLQKPAGLLTAIEQLVKYGLLFVSGVPNQETSHERCELTRLAERFGEIRETFYGRVWDVKNVERSKNIAYTNLDLGLHMDLLYFQHPPRYQILHCLRNRVAGGSSLFLDAIHAARELRSDDPAAFDTLAATPVPFHYINDGHHLHCAHPTIELASPSLTSTSTPTSRPATAHPGPDVAFVNYSPPFQAPLAPATPPAFYTALRAFASILADPANTHEYTLREGDAVVFDNRRVLHARRSFGEGERWLKGCYLEADSVLDRMRVLQGRVGKV